MPTTPERLASLETMVGEIHRAVVGNGAPGASLPEQVTALRTEVESHKSHHRWSSTRSIAVATATALGTALGMKVMVGL